MIITDIKDLIGVFGNFKQINGMPETNDDGFTFMGEKVKIVSESKKASFRRYKQKRQNS